MTLRIAEKRTFSRTIYTADGQDFVADFVIISDEEADLAHTGGVDGDKAILRAIVHRLSDIETDDGLPVPYTPDVLEQVIDFTDLRIALLRAYNEGRIEARRGN